MLVLWKVLGVMGVLYAAYWVADLLTDGWSPAGAAGVVLGVSWVAMGVILPRERKRQEQAAREAEEVPGS